MTLGEILALLKLSKKIALDNLLEILKPHYEGERFKDHTLPLDIIEDLIIFQKLISELAKHHFLEANPSRTRITKNFNRDINFELSTLREGSTIPVIAIRHPNDQIIDHGKPIYYMREGVNTLLEIIENGNNENLNGSQNIPNRIFELLSSLGKGLKPEEHIILENGGDKRPVFNHRTKSIMENMVTKKAVEMKPFTYRGYVSGWDKDNKFFTFKHLISNKGTFQINSEKYPSNVFEQAFERFHDKAKIQISGIADFLHGRLENLIDIEDAQILDSLDIPSQLEEMLSLKKGWFDGNGNEYDELLINNLIQQFEENYNYEAPLPRIYPTPYGEVLCEWKIDELDISLEIDLNNLKAYFHQLNLETKEDFEEDINLSELEGWNRLNELIGSKSNKSS